MYLNASLNKPLKNTEVKMNKREPWVFWIKGVTAHEFEVVNSIKVIEKTAYDELKAKAEKATKLIEQLPCKCNIHNTIVDVCERCEFLRDGK